jgi:hypothetical protein
MKSLNEKNQVLAKIFNLPLLEPTYLNYKTISELNLSLGFVYKRFSDNWPSYGLSDVINNRIYFSGQLNDGHELVHLYVFKKFGINTFYWFNEGFATYLFGCFEDTVLIDYQKLKKDLKKHPEFDLNNVLDFSSQKIDLNTNYCYTIGALLCKIAFDKNGFNGVLNLLNSGNTAEDFYKGIEKHLGVKRENLNEFIRNELEKY